MEHTGLINCLRRRKVNKHLIQRGSANISLSPREGPPTVLPHPRKGTGALCWLPAASHLAPLLFVSLGPSRLHPCPFQLSFKGPTAQHFLSLPPPGILKHNADTTRGGRLQEPGAESYGRCSGWRDGRVSHEDGGRNDVLCQRGHHRRRKHHKHRLLWDKMGNLDPWGGRGGGRRGGGGCGHRRYPRAEIPRVRYKNRCYRIFQFRHHY